MAEVTETPTADYDSPWKEALQRYFRAFLAMFFPAAHDDIDWSRGYEMLDKELQQIAPEAETGRRVVDVLVKVWRRGGDEQWVLIHVEVQAQPDPQFPRRMFVYYHRVGDRYDRPVASFALLADDRPGWRPDRFTYDLWGCSVDFRFPTVKLLDLAADAAGEARLEASDNPFAVVVLAHLKAQQTAGDAGRRGVWKVRLIKGLYGRGWEREDVRELVRLIDWFLRLPPAAETQVRHEIKTFEQENRMPYVMSYERMAREEGKAEGEAKGLKEGIALGLKLKFGEAGLSLMPEIGQLSDPAVLRRVADSIEAATTVEDVRRGLT